jgi:hypothetical protein
MHPFSAQKQIPRNKLNDLYNMHRLSERKKFGIVSISFQLNQMIITTFIYMFIRLNTIIASVELTQWQSDWNQISLFLHFTDMSLRGRSEETPITGYMLMTLRTIQ